MRPTAPVLRVVPANGAPPSPDTLDEDEDALVDLDGAEDEDEDEDDEDDEAEDAEDAEDEDDAEDDALQQSPVGQVAR